MIIENEIKYKNIILRNIYSEDVGENYLNWIGDISINRYLETRFNRYSLSELKHYVNNINISKNDLMLGVFLIEDGLHIGNIKLGSINWIHKRAEIGVLIGEKKFHSKGYGTEAIQILTDYSHKVLGLRKISAGVYSENKASQSAFLKSHYILEATLKDHWLLDGLFIDQLIFSHYE